MPHASALKTWLMVPVASAVFCAAWLWRRVVPPKSADQVRMEDRAHQKAVRRQLRGLPAEQAPTAPRGGP